MEIERKFLVKTLPINLSSYPSSHIEQGYLNTDPVIRIRKYDQQYFLTYKSKGFLERQEIEVPLDETSYQHLVSKIDGCLIIKTRYKIPYQHLTIELDIFSAPINDLILAEVEFEHKNDALSFIPPEWFGKEVTYQAEYHNNYLSQKNTR